LLSNFILFLKHSNYYSYVDHGGNYYPDLFTEKDIHSSVFIVTDGSAGIGLELVKILYSKRGTLYIAGRSPTKISSEIEAKNSIPTTNPANMKSLFLDLNVLNTVKTCVFTFLTQESRRHFLCTNI